MTNLEAIESELLRRMMEDWELRLWFRENRHIALLWTDHTRKCICILISQCSTLWEIMQEAEGWGDGWDATQWLVGLQVAAPLPETSAQLVDAHWTLIVPHVSRKLAEQYNSTQNPVCLSLLAVLARCRPGRSLWTSS